jgi:hypothetical protein
MSRSLIHARVSQHASGGCVFFGRHHLSTVTVAAAAQKNLPLIYMQLSSQKAFCANTMHGSPKLCMYPFQLVCFRANVKQTCPRAWMHAAWSNSALIPSHHHAHLSNKKCAHSSTKCVHLTVLQALQAVSTHSSFL